MGPPDIGADTRVPNLPATYFRRPRLDGAWQEWQAKRLVLVTAGAGFGKSLFLADCARRGERPCFWVSLDEADAEPAGFQARLLLALRAPARTPAKARDRGPTLEELPNEMGRALQRLPGRAMVVLDDVQLVAHSAEVRSLLERLPRLLPDDAILVLSSREPTGVSTARLATQGLVGSLGTEELRFTEPEVVALYARRFPRSSLDPVLARRIVDATEGWAAGIEILFQAAGGPSSPAIEAAIDRFARAGSGAFAYFAEEVMRGLDPGTRDFLTRSSVLPTLTPDLCDRVLEIEGSGAILENLERRNLFTFRVGEHASAFRTHALFRDYLADRLRREAHVHEVRALERRAGDAFAAVRMWAEASAAYAEAGDADAALAVVEKHGREIFAAGGLRVLRRALSAVPAEALRRTPAALFLLGRLQEVGGEWEKARRACKTALAAAPRGRLRAEILTLLGQIELRRARYSDAKRHLRESISFAGRDAFLRAGAHSLLGIAAAETGNLAEAEKHFRATLGSHERAGDAAGEARARFLLASNIHYFRGEFRSAKDEARRALAIYRDLNDPRRVAHATGGLGFFHAAIAEPETARELTGKAKRLAADLGYRMIEAYCDHTLGLCALQSGDLREARACFERARAAGEELGEPSLRTLPRVGLAEVSLAEGNTHAARVVAREGLDLARARHDPFQEAECLVLLGLACTQNEGRLRSAHWARAEKLYRAVGASFGLHRLLLFRLDCEARKGIARSRVLEELLSGAARMEHLFLFERLEPDRAARVLPLAIEEGIETAVAAGVLERLGPRVIPHLAPLLGSVSEKARETAVAILGRIGGDEARRLLEPLADRKTSSGRAALRATRALEARPGGAMRICALGRFRVEIDGAEVPAERWRSDRAARLMKLLLVNRFRWVPKETAIEALWPETDPALTENNLRQSVYLLRKALGPETRETKGSRFVRVLNEAYRLDPGTGYDYDVERFEGAARKASGLSGPEKRGEMKAALAEAVSLYRGAFLEESPFEEFLVVERERLRDRFLWALGKLIGICEREGKWEEVVPLCRRGFAEDAYAEDFHAGLMRSLLEMGHRKEAWEAWDRYEKRVCRELGIEPSETMRALGRKVSQK